MLNSVAISKSTCDATVSCSWRYTETPEDRQVAINATSSISDFPINPTGKIQKFTLADWVREGRLKPVSLR